MYKIHLIASIRQNNDNDPTKILQQLLSYQRAKQSQVGKDDALLFHFRDEKTLREIVDAGHILTILQNPHKPFADQLTFA